MKRTTPTSSPHCIKYTSDNDILELQQWCTDHSHSELYDRLQELETGRLGYLEAHIDDWVSKQYELEQRLAKLELLCQQCYLESKGEGP